MSELRNSGASGNVIFGSTTYQNKETGEECFVPNIVITFDDKTIQPLIYELVGSVSNLTQAQDIASATQQCLTAPDLTISELLQPEVTETH